MTQEEEILDLDQVMVDPACVMRVSAAFAYEHAVMPLCMIGGDFVVAMANPADARTIAQLRRALGVPVVVYSARADQLAHHLARIYGNIQAVQGDMRLDGAVSTVEYLLRAAYLRHASDIHFDPDPGGIRVRFRVDGELEEAMRIPPELQPSVTSRLKVMGEVKLDERRAPQDGAFSWEVPVAASGGESISLDVRLATLPGRYGEKVTLRLLETDAKLYTMDMLGMDDEARAGFEEVLANPYGLVLLTGPTGSGKTTTLYAAIQYLLQRRPLNILTVENPIEYEIPGIFQAEVDAVDKVNFSKALRSILRHDPDVIMIGEMRDHESLDTAAKAALTGHLVLSTLHTNDAVNAVTRMVNMGLERHIVAATLRLSAAQRLVRRMCPFCREPYALTGGEAAMFGEPSLEGQTVYRARGCVCCAGRGLKGRLGLFELFRPDVAIASAIADGAPETELRRMHVARGHRTLLDDGWLKCQRGETVTGEVFRVAVRA